MSHGWGSTLEKSLRKVAEDGFSFAGTWDVGERLTFADPIAPGSGARNFVHILSVMPGRWYVFFVFGEREGAHGESERVVEQIFSCHEEVLRTDVDAAHEAAVDVADLSLESSTLAIFGENGPPIAQVTLQAQQLCDEGRDVALTGKLLIAATGAGAGTYPLFRYPEEGRATLWIVQL
jgi:hypothetical protein